MSDALVSVFVVLIMTTLTMPPRLLFAPVPFARDVLNEVLMVSIWQNMVFCVSGTASFSVERWFVAAKGAGCWSCFCLEKENLIETLSSRFSGAAAVRASRYTGGWVVVLILSF